MAVGALRFAAMGRAKPLVAIALLLVGVHLSGAPQTTSPVRLPTIGGGVFEASGAATVPGTLGALVVDDGLTRELLWVTIDPTGASARATRVPLGAAVLDKEDITTDGTFFYVVGSQSQGGGRNAAGLVRFRFDPDRLMVSGVETVTGLRALMTTAVPELAGLAGGRAGPLNIEGLAWDAGRSRLIFGLRTPMDRMEALLVTARLRDPGQPLSNQNLQFDPAVIRLDLGGLAVRGLGYDTTSRRVLVLAGSAADGGKVTRVFEWDGEASSAVLVRTIASDAKPEGITRFALDGRPRTLVVYDAGRFELVEP